MAVLSYPGVYVEEVSSGVRPIAAVSTSTPAFVGLAEKGPDDQALRIGSWTEFQRHYGTFIAESYLAQSVFQFFNNGGQQCYVVRATHSDAKTAAVTVQNRALPPTAGVQFTARNKGAWANSLYLQIEDGSNDPGNEFKISVRRPANADIIPEDLVNVPPLEVHDNLSVDPQARNFFNTMLLQNSNLIQAVIAPPNTQQQRGVHYGGFDHDIGLEDKRDFQINIDNDGYQTVHISDPLTNLDAIAATIQTEVRKLTKQKVSTLPAAFTGFTCVVEKVKDDSRLKLESGTQGKTSSVLIQNAQTNNAATLLKLGIANGGRSENGIAIRRPANDDGIRIGESAVKVPVTAATLGLDGTAAINELSYSSRFPLLNSVNDFSLLAVPGFGTTIMMDEGMAYCEGRSLRDVFYIGEMTQDDDTPEEAATFRKRLAKPNSYGAVYFPWVKALDPSGKSTEPILLPPSGYIAGLYARIDANRGVWKGPAGTEATLSGAVGLATNLTDVEQGNLNRLNINCIRRFNTAGIAVWGARTITSDAEYQYVPIRRMAIMLRVSIYNGIQWAVFEPNDEPLWAQLRLNVRSFMTALFQRGAFQGATPSQAFFVKCDAETTTQANINEGLVNVLVGFAPLRPAEFVVVRISQMAGQSS